MVSNRSITPSLPDIPNTVDDLKRIKGIGQGVEKRLNQAGIFSFSQLAASSPKKISRILSDMIGNSAEKIKQQDWTGQASQLALEARPDESINMPVKLDERQRYETFSVKLLLNKVNEVRRTNIVHVQKGTEQNWAGWDEQRLVSFVVENADLNVTASKATVQMNVESVPVTDSDMALAPVEIEQTTGRHKHTHPHHKGTLTIDRMNICENGSLETSNIIAKGHDWSIRLGWTLSGVEPLFGNWLVKVYLESLGPGKEYVLPLEDDVRLALIDGEMKAPNVYLYSNEMNFKAGEIDAGVYWLIVTIAWEKHLGKLGDLTGFSEKSMLQFY